MSFTSSERLKRLGPWNCAAIVAWSAAILGIILHRAFSHSRTTLEVFQLAGHHWIHGEYLYADRRGFVYSPLAAALFSGLEVLPRAAATIVWVSVNATALLSGMFAMLKGGFAPAIRREHFGVAFLLLLPLAIGNLDVLQANALVIGLLMHAFSAADRNRWGIAAICIAVATYFKIYPFAAGLLLILLAPWRFGWRLTLAMLAFGLLPFLFQHWAYVSEQYHSWIVTRTADNRLQYSDKDAPLDLWFVLVRLGHLPLTAGIYRLMQVAGGGAIALFELYGIWRNGPRARILAGAFAFLSVWMTLIGPATEGYTYLLLAPAVAIAVVEIWSGKQGFLECVGIAIAFAFLLFAMARNSFFPHARSTWIMSAQPIGAAIFLGVCLLRLRMRASLPSRK